MEAEYARRQVDCRPVCCKPESRTRSASSRRFHHDEHGECRKRQDAARSAPLCSFDIDEPRELGGSDRFANPQEHLLAALNACMMVGYVAQCAVHGITLEKLEIETDGAIDLRGFLGIDAAVPPGYKSLSYVVRIKGNDTREQFAEIHKAVMATSPNFHNVSRPVDLKPTLVVE
jgi:uncharacterized OsmC-like protein